MAQRNVTTSGSHLAKALVTPTGATTDVTLANVAQAALSVASADAAGRVELATSAETAAGQDATRAVTPAGLAAQKFIKSTDVTYKALNDNVAVGSGSSQVARGNHGHTAATATTAGYLSAADKAKLEGIEAKATADQTGAEIVAAVNAELGGSQWQQGGGTSSPHTHSAGDLPDRGAFYGKALGASLTDKNSTVEVNIAGLPGKAAAAGADLVPIWDPQAAAHRHVPVAGLPAGRGIVAPAGDDPAISMELPAAVNRRDFLLGFTATGAVTTTKVATAADVDELAARGMTTIDTIAELRAYRPRRKDATVYVRGYHTPGDGGGGMFMWEAAADNRVMVTGATIINGGAGYKVGEIARPATGTGPIASDGSPTPESSYAWVVVTSVTDGVATGITLFNRGCYATAPSSSATVATNNVDKGLTLNFTTGPYEDFGTVIAVPGQTGRWRRDLKNHLRWNIRWFGAKGDNQADDTEALQAAINAKAPLYLPAGIYRTNTLLLVGGGHLNMEGASPIFFGHRTSLVGLNSATSVEPLIHHAGNWVSEGGTTFENGGTNGGMIATGGQAYGLSGWIKVHLKNLSIKASTSNVLGSALEIQSALQTHIENCAFDGSLRGLTLASNCFDTTLDTIWVTSNFFAITSVNRQWADPEVRAIAGTAWGIYVPGHANMKNIMCQGPGTGIYISGIGNTLTGSRIEACGHGIIMSDVYGSFLGGLSFEACGYGLYIKSMVSTTISGMRIQGTTSYSNLKTYVGIYVTGRNAIHGSSKVENVSTTGNFLKAAIINHSMRQLCSVSAGNALAPNIRDGGTSAPFLNYGTGFDSEPIYHLVNCNMFPSTATRRHMTITAFHDLMLPGLTGLNLRDRATSGTAAGGAVFAKNLGGVVAPANGSSTAAVAFLDSRGGGQIALVLTASSNASSTLQAGTYYYATTVVGPHGETSLNMYQLGTEYASITITEGQQVSISFSNTGSVTGYRRRLYRGRELGYFEGCYEKPNINDHTAIVDDGSISYSLKTLPPSRGEVPKRWEDDANYQIIAQASWPTTVHVTSKATTGFTLNFGTAAPDANQTVSWLLFRP